MSSYSGSLSSKVISDLREIADALNIDHTDLRKTDLRNTIQSYLDKNESTLSVSEQFKGLFKKRTDSDSETSVKPRRSIKGVDRIKELVDAANIPLPESPLKKVQEAANSAVVLANDASHALVPNHTRRDLTLYAQQASNYLSVYTQKSQQRIDLVTHHAKQFLATPDHLILSALALEVLHLFTHVSQSYNHTIFFPPPGGSSGTIGSLLHSAFFWAPKVQFTLRLPEWADFFGGHNQLWGALAWWFTVTVLPAAAASTIFQFGAVPVPHRGPTTRHQAAQRKSAFIDTLSFALFRFALVLWPLTTAAPSAIVDSLELSGNLQGRALAAGTVLALTLIQRLQQ